MATPWMEAQPEADRSVLAGLGLVMAFSGVAGGALPYLKLQNALASGQYRVVEGTLTDFQPGNPGRPARDQTFTVAGKRFVISASEMLFGFPGFHPSTTPPLPAPEGAWVRITYVDSNPPKILKIEANR